MYLIGETLRIGGSTRSDYLIQFLVNILSYLIPPKDTPDPIGSSTAKDYARKRKFLLGMMSASSKAVSFPDIDLSGEKMPKIKLSKSRGVVGKLKI